MSPTELREFSVDFLRRELVGPDPIAPDIQANGEEILTGDPPRLRYGAGILFPKSAPAETSTDVSPAEAAGIAEAISTVPFEDTQKEEVTSAGGDGAVDADKSEPVGDETVALANAYLPSAMGFSCLVEIPVGGLTVEVEAGRYQKVRASYTNKKGEVKPTDHYHRAQITQSITLSEDDLSGAGTVQDRKPVKRGDGTATGLEVRWVSRPRPSEGGRVKRLLTVNLVNTYTSADLLPENERCFFQIQLALKAPNGENCFLEYPDALGGQLDEEEEQLELLYRHRKTYAIGHGCAADWVETIPGRAGRLQSEIMPQWDIKPIVPTQLDNLKLDMLTFSDLGDEGAILPRLTTLCNLYANWISDQQAVVEAADFPAKHQAAAKENLEKCLQCLERMRGGILLLSRDKRVMQAFRLMNRAMLLQQLHYALPLREWTAPVATSAAIAAVAWPDVRNLPASKGNWYPFQIAFILLNLRSLTEPDDVGEQAAYLEERGIADLIWFPTGGGKTEAYLGLTAFSILMRRLRSPQDAGTTVIMRYTLRLLTAQQFQRAASLICALERMRRADSAALGTTPVTIGLWVGDLTPRKRADATDALTAMTTGRTHDNQFVVLKCPWCGAQMGPREFGNRQAVFGYERMTRPATVAFRCSDPVCEFGGASRLPLTVIDEDLYDNPPTLLLGTVDKFAQLPWQPAAHKFFGLHSKDVSPPELIIQDELHLISGPLGSMVGLYETVIQELCTRKSGGMRIGPKILASTATISRAAEQCHALYNCGMANVRQFPPQCLKAGDSFFAEEAAYLPGRLYVGVMAPALSSFVTAQVRTLSALLQAPMSADVVSQGERDSCWTLMTYFNNLRVLGHAVTLVGADIPEHLQVIRHRHKIGKPADGEVDRRRFINEHLELNSRESSARIAKALQRLETVYPATGNERPVDICLATNMISVGLDVPRLGLMTVIGQPKTTSEYIQATSRVGRRTPGLVTTLYHPGKPRDRSHYEHFRSYHQSIYRYVEPTSVTPFAPPVRERALHALLVILVRYLGSAENSAHPEPMPADTILDEARRILMTRVNGVDAAESGATADMLEELIVHWEGVLPPIYGRAGGPPPDELPLMYPAGSEPPKDWNGKSWKTPMSMRDVDAECEAMTIGSYPTP